MAERPTTTPPVADEHADGATRLTPRQRRIEEQRRRIEGLRREQRRKRAIWGTVILVAFALVVGLVVLMFRPPLAAQGRQVFVEGQGHVEPGTPITYQNNPPTSGTHYPTTSGYGVFERAIEPGYWVHTLEHGGIVLLFNPAECDAACLEQLRDVYRSAPPSQLFRQTKMAVVPYPGLATKVAVLAWGWIDTMDEVDKDRILAFYRTHVDRGPETAL